MNYHEILFFAGFLVFIILILGLDLGLFSRNSHVIGYREATIWSLVWIGLSICFYFLLHFYGDIIHGFETTADIQVKIDKYLHPISIDNLSFEEALRVYRSNLALEYLTGYLIEKALSVDNIFVIIMIFYAFGVDKKYYKRVLVWGIIGAVVMRFIFIFVASALVQRFGWILYFFGILLILTGIRMFLNRNKEKKIEPKKHPMVKLASKFFSVYPHYVKQHFIIRKEGKFFITPLLIVLLVVEFSDVLFAIDSIPAIFSITKDPYIVFFSNIFAILGLRALFFLIVNVINAFHYLVTGLSLLLVFIGVKMLIHGWLKDIGFQTYHSLLVVVGIIALSVIASLIFPKKEKPASFH